MERNIFEKQRDLNDRLNRYRDEYYNRNAPSVSDEVYDRLFDLSLIHISEPTRP